MNTLLVTYHIDDPTHEAVIDAYLDSFDSARLSQTSRVVDTALHPDELFRNLKTRLGRNDRIYVFPVDKGWTGYGYEATNEWLSRHVGPGPVLCP